MQRHLVNFIALMVAIFAALYYSGPASSYAALRDHGKETSALITSLKCDKSLSFYYTFVVASRPYIGRDAVTDCGRFVKGDALQIVYLPDDPTTNYYSNPADAYTNNVWASLFAAFIFSGGINAMLYLRRESRAAKRDSQP